MEINIIERQNQLAYLETFVKDVDTEVTMILQSLQWDRNYLMQTKSLVSCQYDSSHRVPPDKLKEHEKVCFLKSQGYSEKDRFLPSPVDADATILVKFGSDEINEILSSASKHQIFFNRGAGCSGIQPLTLGRLQATYTYDERRAIHDAVINQVPSCHNLSDLTLLSAQDGKNKDNKPKSKLEILAELRDMKRRRTKYRVAAKTRNYSDVLRDVIHTQMELYTKIQEKVFNIKKEEETEDLQTSTDKYSSKFLHKRDLKSEYHLDNGRSSDKYGDHRHSRHHEDYKSRKRRHTGEYQPNKYSKLGSSKHHNSCEREKERNVEPTSGGRGDKYERRKESKEKHKREHEDYHRRKEYQDKQHLTIAIKDIKKEKVDSTETVEKHKSLMSTEKNIRTNESRESLSPSEFRSKVQSHNKYSNKDENNYDKRIIIKKEVGDDGYYNNELSISSDINYSNKKGHRKEHYDEHKYRKNRYVKKRPRDGEKDKVDKDRTNKERESGWSDDSEDGKSERRYQRSKNEHSSAKDKHNRNSRHDKDEYKMHDKHERHRHKDHKRKDYRSSKHDNKTTDRNKKSPRSRCSPGDSRESESYQEGTCDDSYYKSYYKSYKERPHK